MNVTMGRRRLDDLAQTLGRLEAALVVSEMEPLAIDGAQFTGLNLSSNCAGRR